MFLLAPGWCVVTDTKPDDGLTVVEALAAVTATALPAVPGSRILSLADVEQLADDGDREKLIAALGLIPVAVSLWPTKCKPVRVRPFRWRWSVTDHPSGEQLAHGHALFERWAWHAAGRAAARIYNARAQEAKADHG
jgi:hypothetical protein